MDPADYSRTLALEGPSHFSKHVPHPRRDQVAMEEKFAQRAKDNWRKEVLLCSLEMAGWHMDLSRDLGQTGHGGEKSETFS
jgi:hypothetical protein